MISFDPSCFANEKMLIVYELTIRDKNWKQNIQKE